MPQTVYDCYRLGFGEPMAVSASTGEGLADLFAALQPPLDAVSAQLRAADEAAKQRAEERRDREREARRREREVEVEVEEGRRGRRRPRLFPVAGAGGGAGGEEGLAAAQASDSDDEEEEDEEDAKPAGGLGVMKLAIMGLPNAVSGSLAWRGGRGVPCPRMTVGGPMDAPCIVRRANATAVPPHRLTLTCPDSLISYNPCLQPNPTQHKTPDAKPIPSSRRGLPTNPCNNFAPASLQGKSTLLNALLGEQRAVTGPEPGLTRDSVRAAWTYGDTAVELVDTAGWVGLGRTTRWGAGWGGVEWRGARGGGGREGQPWLSYNADRL